MSDFEDAAARIHWADGEINHLEAGLADHCKQKLYGLREEEDPLGRGILFRFKEVEPVPMVLMASAGAILHSQRAALDSIVYSLSKRNGNSSPTNTGFPIAQSRENLVNDGRMKACVRLLSEEDRNKIYRLKPYQSGNRLLYALHHLNIRDKHKELLTTVGRRGKVEFGGMGQIGLVLMWDSFKDGDPVALVKKSSGITVDLPVDIAFNDVPGLGDSPAVKLLKDFSLCVKSAIRLFE